MSTQTVTQRRTAQVSPATQVGTPKQFVTKRGVQVNRVPSAKPSFTVGDIRRAIPSHCFTRPLSKSFGYLFADIILAAVIFYASTFIDTLGSDQRFGTTFGPVVRHVMWTAYWIAQGCVCTGLWVLGHECGHRGFADSELVNDAVGLIVHSCLLVPYFAWQISHKRHHSNTGSVEHDEVFVPQLATEKQRAELAKRQAADHDHEDGMFSQLASALGRIFWMVIMFTLGWPFYLLANFSGNRSYDPHSWVNHFTPGSPIFNSGSETDAKNQKLIVISDLAVAAVLVGLYKLSQLTSASYMFYVYFMPYLVVNFWLVLITYLQHTDIVLPHYTDGEWDWLRGALATVDRDYGILNHVFHNIADTHVVHHLFHTMPHYHAMEATVAVRPLLGEYYRFDSTPVATALWNSFKHCDVVYQDKNQKGVHWFEPR